MTRWQLVVASASFAMIACSSPNQPHVAGVPTHDEVGRTCEPRVAEATAQRARGELRAALQTLASPDLVENTCPSRDTLKQAVTAELGVATTEPDAAQKAASRKQHAVGIEALRDGSFPTAITALTAANAAWPHPRILSALATAHELALDAKAARIARDRAIALAETAGAGVVGQSLAALAIGDFVYDASGRWIVSWDEGSLAVWDPTTGQALHEFGVGEDVLGAVAGDGTITVAGAAGFYVVDLYRGDVIAKHPRTLQRVTGSVDGKRLLVGDGTNVGLVDTATLDATVWSAKGNDSLFAFALDAAVVVTGAIIDSPKPRDAAPEDEAPRHGVISIRDATTGKVKRTIKVPAQVVRDGIPGDGVVLRDLDVSPDGKLIAVAGVDRAHVFETTTGKKLSTFETDDWPTDVSFLPDGRLLANDHIVDPRTGKRADPRYGCPGGFALRPDRRELACVGDKGIGTSSGIAIRQLDGKVLRSFGRVNKSYAPQFEIAPDGKTLAVAQAGNLVVFDLATGARRIAHEGTAWISTVAHGKRGFWIGAGNDLVEVGSSRAPISLPKRVNALSFRHDANELVFAQDSELVVVTVEPFAEKHRLTGMHRWVVATTEWSRDGKRLLSRGRDLNAGVWDVDEKKLVHQIYAANANGIPIVAMHPDGKRYVARSRSPNEGGEVFEIGGPHAPLAPPGAALHYLYGPDGTLYGFSRTEVHVYRPSKPATAIALPEGFIEHARLHPDGKRVIAARDIGILMVIDLVAGKVTARLDLVDPDNWIVHDGVHVDGSPSLAGYVIRYGDTFELPATLDTVRRKPGLLADLL